MMFGYPEEIHSSVFADLDLLEKFPESIVMLRCSNAAGMRFHRISEIHSDFLALVRILK